MPVIDPDILLRAYRQGVFPMTDPDGRIRWYTADPRGILPLDALHIPRSLHTVLRQGRFEIRIDTDFEQTMRQCMLGRAEGSWISPELIAAYVVLHRRGSAHSVETWQDGELAGGLYGVSIGAAFFGESMFYRRPDASKVALVHLVHRLRERGYELLDTQAVTAHLRRFGCIEIPAGEYARRLAEALKRECSFV